MGGDGVPRDTDTYALAISACARSGGRGALARASELYSRMRAREGLAPSLGATNALIGAQARGGTADARACALRTFCALARDSKSSARAPPDSVTYNQVLDALWRGQHDAAVQLDVALLSPSATRPRDGALEATRAPPGGGDRPRRAAEAEARGAEPSEGATHVELPPLDALDELFAAALRARVYTERVIFPRATVPLPSSAERATSLHAVDDADADDALPVIDCHALSPGAAVAAVRHWRGWLAREGEGALLDRTGAEPVTVAIVTGWGRRARVAQRSGEAASERGLVRRAVLHELRASGAPLFDAGTDASVPAALIADGAVYGPANADARNPGRVLLRTAQLLAWAREPMARAKLGTAGLFDFDAHD
mgnify:CR=1 FL=1